MFTDRSRIHCGLCQLILLLIASLIGTMPSPLLRAESSDDLKNDSAVSPEVKRARELIYLFRQFRVFSRDEEWAQTVRELVEIGKPAVPELVAELDLTTRNNTIRSLGFTLRAIGDPRAVPALIRAIPKTRANQGSDCGISIQDPDLRAFMKKHQNHPQPDEDRSVLRGRPVNEIVTALEKLTGHKPPHPEVGRDDRRERWLEWWEEHKNEFPIDDDLLAAEKRNPEDDPVDTAGIAKYGPLFPTGGSWRLGPVQEFQLGSDQYTNAKAFLDFDSGQIFEIRQGWQRPDSWTLSDLGPSYFQWIKDRGIDLRNSGSFEGYDLSVWLIEDDRWDTIEEEVRSGKRLELGPETSTHIELYSVLPPEFQKDRIGTFLFTTRNGGRGVLRLVPGVGESGSRRLQYRLFESGDQPRPGTVVEPAPNEKTRFHKTVTLTLPLAQKNSDCLLDLETEKKYQIPPEFKNALSNPANLFHEAASAEWCQTQGIDMAAFSINVANDAVAAAEVPDKKQTAILVACRNLRNIQILPKSFYHLSIEEVQELFRRNPMDPAHMTWMRFMPATAADVATYAIESDDGMIGVIKLEQIPNESDKILVRYRLHLTKKQ